MRYCSHDARKVVSSLAILGYVCNEDDYFDVEQAIGKFWPTHITGVIEDVLKPTSKQTKEQKLERAQTAGWAYFLKPITSMLTTRGNAHRTDDVDFEATEWKRTVYNIVTTGYVVADFTVKELKLLVQDISDALSSEESAPLSYAIAASKKVSRNIFYLNGVVKRDADTKKGKAIELQEQVVEDSDKGWVVPKDFEILDIVERRELLAQWKEKQIDILISKGLNSV